MEGIPQIPIILHRYRRHGQLVVRVQAVKEMRGLVVSGFTRVYVAILWAEG